jgi:putative transcriptional regulator
MTHEMLNRKRMLQNGLLLISEPFLPDPNFERTVVLICEHSQNGSFGLILNKPTHYLMKDVSDTLDLEQTLFSGGPVEPNSLHYIHRIPELQGSLELKNKVFWGGNYEQFCMYAQSGLITDQNCRFFSGYSGWSKSQLESELQRNTWIICDYDLAKIFDISAYDMWREVLRSMGGKYRMFSNFPTDPKLN